jgi:hypothetical protein
MSESQQSAGTSHSGRRETAAVALVKGSQVSEPAPAESEDEPEAEAAPRRARMQPETVTALKVLLAVLVLGLPLTYLATLDTPGLDNRVPVPPPPTTLEGVGLGMSDFDAEQAAAVARIEALVDEAKYREALQASEEYPDLVQVQALRALAQLELDRRREAQILEELKHIPVSEFEQNRDRYAELVELNPDEAEYQKKLEFYEKKVREQREN